MKMKILDFLIQVGIFKSKGEAIRSIKGKITLKLNDIEINESHLDGDITLLSGCSFNQAAHQLNVLLAIILLAHIDIKNKSSISELPSLKIILLNFRFSLHQFISSEKI